LRWPQRAKKNPATQRVKLRAGLRSSAYDETSVVVTPVAVLVVFVSIVLVVRPILLVVIVVAIAVATELFEGGVRCFAFLFAQFAIAIPIEALHETGSARFAAARMIAKVTGRTITARTIATGAGATMRTMLSRLIIVFVVVPLLVIVVVVAVLPAVSFVPTAPARVKCLARGIAFFVAQLAVAIFVHAAEHRLANFFARRSMMPATVRGATGTATSMVRTRTVMISIRQRMIGTMLARRRSSMVGAAMRRSERMWAATMGKRTARAGAVWPTGRRTTAMRKSMLAVRTTTAITRYTMVAAMVRMMAASIAPSMVTGMPAVFAVTRGYVGRSLDLLAHRGPFVVAQLAVAIAIEARKQHMAQGITAGTVSRTSLTAGPTMARAVLLASTGRLAVIHFLLVFRLALVFVLFLLLLVFFVFVLFASGGLALFLGRIIVGPCWQRDASDHPHRQSKHGAT